MANRGGQIKPYDGEPPHWKHELCDYGSSFSRFMGIWAFIWDPHISQSSVLHLEHQVFSGVSWHVAAQV